MVILKVCSAGNIQPWLAGRMQPLPIEGTEEPPHQWKRRYWPPFLFLSGSSRGPAFANLSRRVGCSSAPTTPTGQCLNLPPFRATSSEIPSSFLILFALNLGSSSCSLQLLPLYTFEFPFTPFGKYVFYLVHNCGIVYSFWPWEAPFSSSIFPSNWWTFELSHSGYCYTSCCS